MSVASTVLKLVDVPVGISFKLATGTVLSVKLVEDRVVTSFGNAIDSTHTAPERQTPQRGMWRTVNSLLTGEGPVTVEIGEFEHTVRFSYTRNGKSETYDVYPPGRHPDIWLQHVTDNGDHGVICNNTFLNSHTGAPVLEVWGSIGTMEAPEASCIKGRRNFDPSSGEVTSDTRPRMLRKNSKARVQGYESLA
jgi:hypothetical protein